MARVGRSYPVPRAVARPLAGGRHVNPQQFERSLPRGGPGLPSGPPAPLAGFGPQSGSLAIPESDRQRALLSWQALRQRIALGVGPTADRWSTNPGDGLTPETIVRCRREAQAGYPWRWADLCEQEIERNDVIKSRLDFRRAWAHQVPWRVDAPDHWKGDALAEKIAAWQTALLNGLRNCWPNAVQNLLSAPAYGYAAAEQFWEHRDISFTFNGKEIRVPSSFVPVHLKEMHQKKFVFHADTDEPMLYTGHGKPGERWPRGKVLFHRALGDGITERRGFMTAAVWIAWARQCAWRDLIIFMHMYGLPQFALMIDAEVLEQPEMVAQIDEGMDQFGQAKIPIWPDQARVEKLGQVEGEAMHPDVIMLADNALSVLITGSILAQTQGTGTGSYGMSGDHAVTAHMYRVPDGVALDRDVGEHTLGPAVEFNVDQLCEAFGATPDQIRARCGWFGWKAVAPAPTVGDIIGHYEKLKAIGFPTSATEISQRTGYAIGQGDDRIGPPLGAATAGESGGQGGVQLTPTQVGAIVSVDEGRASVGLGPDEGGNGELKVAQLVAQEADTVAAAAAAEAGQDAPTSGKEPAKFERSAAPAAGGADPGVMVALYPAPELAAALALPGGEPAPELHVTLAYLGRRSEVEFRAPLAKIAQALQLITAAPLEGVIGGVGRFSASETSDGKDVVYASVDVPGLVELRQSLLLALDVAGAEVANNHGFTPHLTLAYVDPAAPSPLQRLEPRPVRFTNLYLVAGEERTAFPLQET